MPRGRKKKKHHFFEHYDDAWLIVAGTFFIALGAIFYAQNILTAEFSKIGDISTIEIPKDLRAWIEIDFGHNKRRLFEGNVSEHQQTLQNALSGIAKEAKISLVMKNGAIAELGNLRQGAHRWHVFINGIKTTKSLSQIMITRGSRYTLKYEL